MFCVKCGKEIETDWERCPYCGAKVVDSESDNSGGQSNVAEEIYIGDSREEIKAYLCKSFIKNSVVIGYGTGVISRDIVGMINGNENIIDFAYAYKSGILGFIKSGRLFRNYLVLTSKRIIYIEKAQKIFSILGFLHDFRTFQYDEIQEVEIDKRIGLYSGVLKIRCNDKKLSLNVLSYKDAEQLRKFILEHLNGL